MLAVCFLYIEAWTRIHGKLAYTQVKCTWILPNNVNEVSHGRARDINFKSAKKKKKAELDLKITSMWERVRPHEQPWMEEQQIFLKHHKDLLCLSVFVFLVSSSPSSSAWIFVLKPHEQEFLHWIILYYSEIKHQDRSFYSTIQFKKIVDSTRCYENEVRLLFWHNTGNIARYHLYTNVELLT